MIEKFRIRSGRDTKIPQYPNVRILFGYEFRHGGLQMLYEVAEAKHQIGCKESEENPASADSATGLMARAKIIPNTAGAKTSATPTEK